MDTPDDCFFLARAIRLSREHMERGHGGPFGAVIVQEGRVVAEGWNQVTTMMDPTAHAEVVAIRAAAACLGTFTLAGCTLYTSCEPCPMCLAAAWWARIDRVVHGATREDAAAAGFDDARLYDELVLPVKKRHLRLESLLREEAAQVLRAWREKPDKVPY